MRLLLRVMRYNIGITEVKIHMSWVATPVPLGHIFRADEVAQASKQASKHRPFLVALVCAVLSCRVVLAPSPSPNSAFSPSTADSHRTAWIFGTGLVSDDAVLRMLLRPA